MGFGEPASAVVDGKGLPRAVFYYSHKFCGLSFGAVYLNAVQNLPRAWIQFFLAGAFLVPGNVTLGQSPPDAPVFPPIKVEAEEPAVRRVLAKPAAGMQGMGAARAYAAQAKLNARVHKRYPHTGGWVVYEIPESTDADAAVSEFVGTGAYSVVEKDQIYTIQATPNDPAYLSGQLWGLHNTGQSGGVADADIDAPEGWDIRTSANPIIVAVIDTGIRYTHQDLLANMWTNPGEIPGNGIDDNGSGYIDDVHGINAINGSGNPMDDNGHGTHCAGTIGGVGNNGTGMTGVAWNMRLMALKFLSAGGSGTTSDAIECIDYARANGADIMSNSWGGGGYSQALFDSIKAARDAGIIFVAAAGNDAQNNDVQQNYPCNYLLENVVSVAATTRTDALASFSNFGSGYVELGAPGQDIYSTVSDSNSSYDTYSGTSMATPHVSGALALMAAQFPGDSARQLINRLQRSVDRIPSLASRTSFGGRLNLRAALTTTSNTPVNDAFADATQLSGSTLTFRSGNGAATRESGEPRQAQVVTSGASVWWKWTAQGNSTVSIDLTGSNFDTVLSVYTGNTFAALAEVAGNDDALPGVVTSRVTFTTVAGTEYRIAVAGKTETTTGLIVMQLSSPPANDAFETPMLVSGAAVDQTSTNVGASKQTGEPSHAGNAGGRSIWFQWTAPTTGPYRIATAGSSFDTLLAVYTGQTLQSLGLAGQNDDESSGLRTSAVTIQAVSGTLYRIAVDGKNGATGSVRLRILQPSVNDNFANGIELAGASVITIGSNITASKESGEPNHGGNAGGKSVWWAWRAAGIGPVEIHTNGSDFDTTVGVYTGSAVNGLTTIASDDDGGNGLASRVVFNPTPGIIYHIAVDGFSGDNGSIQLSLSQSVINTPPSVVSASVSPSPDAWLDQALQVVSAQTSDPEEDPVTLSYQWQSSSDGYLFTNAAGAVSATLPAAAANSGKVWRCRITPSDPMAEGQPFLTDEVRINRRPVQVAYHGETYDYDSDLFLRSRTATFPRSAIINELSQGPSGGTQEWIELLFLEDTNVQGWTLRDTNTTVAITFSTTAAQWANIPAGTLLVLWNGSQTKDPALPADSLDVSNGSIVVASNQSGLFTGSWPILNNGGGDGFAVRDAGGTLVDGVSIGGQTSFQPQLGTVQGSRSARYNGNTEAGAELVSEWSVVLSAQGVVSPGLGNTTANIQFVNDLRTGAFSDPALFRFAISSDIVPGLSIDPATGLITGTPDVPAGGFFEILIERYTSSESTVQSFTLLVGSDEHVFVIPQDRIWSLDGPTQIFGSLRVLGSLAENDHTLTIRQTYESWLAMQTPQGDDGDAFEFLLEYAFDLDPHVNDQRSVPSLELAGGSMFLKYRRQKDPTELIYHVEFSTNLDRWDPVELDEWNFHTNESVSLDAEEVTLTRPFDATDTAKFYRVRVVRPLIP